MDLNARTLEVDSSASEAYLLGAVLTDGSWIDDLRTQVDYRMFSIVAYAAIFRRMCNMAANDEPCDLMAFVAANPDVVEKFTLARLVELQQTYFGDSSVPWHVAKVKEIYMRRLIIKQLDQLRSDALDVAGKTTDEIRSAVEQIAMSTAQVATSSGLVDGSSQALEWYEQIEARQKDPSVAFGFPVGWQELDKLTLGFHRGDLIVVGGRTSVGKSAFATECIIRLTASGFKTAVFSLEMSKEQIRNRVSSNLSGVPLGRLRTGQGLSVQDMEKVFATTDEIAKIAIDDERGVTADYIASEMKRWKRTRGLDFVVVDYLQEVEEPHEANDNNGSAYGRVARKLRQAAQKCDCAVMALSQLSREAEGAKPKVKHLSGSAGIESAADVIILLHREKEASPDVMEVELAKQRNGPTGDMNLHYDRTLQRLTSIQDSFNREG